MAKALSYIKINFDAKSIQYYKDRHLKQTDSNQRNYYVKNKQNHDL